MILVVEVLVDMRKQGLGRKCVGTYKGAEVLVLQGRRKLLRTLVVARVA